MSSSIRLNHSRAIAVDLEALVIKAIGRSPVRREAVQRHVYGNGNGRS